MARRESSSPRRLTRSSSRDNDDSASTAIGRAFPPPDPRSSLRGGRPGRAVRQRAYDILGFAALGIGAASDSTFYAAGSGAAVQFRKLVLLGRIASVGPKKENRMEDLGLLAGIGTRPGRVHVAVAAGLGVAHNSRDTSALAVPLEAQVTWRFSHVVGLGLRGFLSVNRIATFGGLTLHVQVGRLR